MSSAERLRRAYFHEEMDRPGVYSRTGFPPGDPSYDRLKAYLQTHSDLKTGWSPRRSGVFNTGERWEQLREPHSEEFERRIDRLRTPKGILEFRSLVGLKGQPGLQETYLIKSRADAEAWLSLPMPTLSGPVDSFFDAVASLGERGIVEVILGMNPAGTAADLMGSELFALTSIDDREMIHALCERRARVLGDLVRYLSARKVGPFFSLSGQEYVLPPLHGPRDFQDFNARYDKPIVDLIHDAGGRVHVHSHGRLRAVFSGFLEIGADVLHPIEPPPMGDVTAAEARALAGDRLCIEGNIQIASLYEHTPEEVRAETDRLIADAFPNRRGLIVSPSASPYIPGGGARCFPQYKAMIDTVTAWKR